MHHRRRSWYFLNQVAFWYDQLQVKFHLLKQQLAHTIYENQSIALQVILFLSNRIPFWKWQLTTFEEMMVGQTKEIQRRDSIIGEQRVTYYIISAIFQNGLPNNMFYEIVHVSVLECTSLLNFTWLSFNSTFNFIVYLLCLQFTFYFNFTL